MRAEAAAVDRVHRTSLAVLIEDGSPRIRRTVQAVEKHLQSGCCVGRVRRPLRTPKHQIHLRGDRDDATGCTGMQVHQRWAARRTRPFNRRMDPLQSTRRTNRKHPRRRDDRRRRRRHNRGARNRLENHRRRDRCQPDYKQAANACPPASQCATPDSIVRLSWSHERGSPWSRGRNLHHTRQHCQDPAIARRAPTELLCSAYQQSSLNEVEEPGYRRLDRR